MSVCINSDGHWCQFEQITDPGRLSNLGFLGRKENNEFEVLESEVVHTSRTDRIRNSKLDEIDQHRKGQHFRGARLAKLDL